MAMMNTSLNILYGAPSAVWTRVVSSDTPTASTVQVEVTLVNKTSTRFAEASFITFNPLPSGDEWGVAPSSPPSNASSGQWAMDKLGEWV